MTNADPLRWKPLVYKLTRKYPKRLRDDARQDAWEAVLIAHNTYDPERGGTLAYWVSARIRWHLALRARQGREVHIPYSAYDALRSAWKWEASQNRAVTLTEMAERVGVDRDVLAAAEHITIQRHAYGRRNRDDREVPICELLRDEQAVMPEDAYGDQELAAVLWAEIERCTTERELGVIRQRAAGETYSQIAKSMGLSRERVRQIERHGCGKARDSLGQPRRPGVAPGLSRKRYELKCKLERLRQDRRNAPRQHWPTDEEWALGDQIQALTNEMDAAVHPTKPAGWHFSGSPRPTTAGLH